MRSFSTVSYISGQQILQLRELIGAFLHFANPQIISCEPFLHRFIKIKPSTKFTIVIDFLLHYINFPKLQAL